MAVGYAIAPKAIAASMKRAGIGVPGILDRLALAAAAAVSRTMIRPKHAGNGDR
jgi:hypothetical protein